MDKLKLSLTILLAVLFTTAFLSVAYAQNTNLDVHIVPEEAEIDIGESIKLDAFAFSLNSAANAPAKIDAITWDVEPDSMGTITDDGFFIAGRRVGIVKIKVTIHIGNHQIVKVHSVGKTACFLADLAPTDSHLKTPYVMGYDLYPTTTMEMKEKVLKQALQENWLLIFEHAPKVRAGYLTEKEGKLRIEEIEI